MSFDSEDIFGNAADELKKLCSQSYDKKLYRHQILSDTPETDKIIDLVSPSTSINNIISLSEDDINEDNLFKKHAIPIKPDYPSDLSDELDTESFLSAHRASKRQQSVRESRRVSLKKTVSKKTVKVTEKGDKNTKNSPLEGVRPKKKTKRKSKNPKDVLSQNLLDRLLSGPNGIQNSSDTNTRNHLSESIENIRTVRRRAGLRSHSTPQYPTINIGNTQEYPDNSEDIPLFSSKPNIPEEIVISEEEEDNEEVSVYVHWQNYEVFKFSLRKFQKLREIFDFFAKKENVSENKLYFAYNDVVLTCDDSPDSIKYNIAKFIEGGLNSRDFINELEPKKTSGIQIKFQCQNVKRPYKSTVQLNEKLSLVMVKCAEHFEKPLYNLRFEFDGECITGATTAGQLELADGDCIDVRIIK